MKNILKCKIAALILAISNSSTYGLAELNPDSIYHYFNNNFILSANSTLTTNYIWRGFSRSADLPAAQAGIQLTSNDSFYGNVWGSNVNFLGSHPIDLNSSLYTYKRATVELIYGAGYQNTFKNFNYNFNAKYYYYPKAKKLDYAEYSANLAYKIFHAGASYAPHIFGTHSNSLYYTTGINLPLPNLNSLILKNISFTGDLGYFQFNKFPLQDLDYFNYRLGLNKQIRNFGFSVAVTGTNNKFRVHNLDNTKVIFSCSVATE